MNEYKSAKPADDDFMKRVRDDYTRAMDFERNNIEAARDDLDFLDGEGQWDDAIKRQRDEEGRPTLVLNQIPQFVQQVTGDIRQMRPSIKVVPVDDSSDPENAEKLAGMIRYIENRSDAAGVYFRSADTQVAAGIGHFRVLTEYADDSTFQQELRIADVDDGISVLWDPDAKLITRADARYCFVPVDMSRDAFEERFPDASPVEMEGAVKSWAYYSEWVTTDTVRVAEYWIKKPRKILLGLTADGKTVDLTEDDAEHSAQEKRVIVEAMGGRVEERETYKVCRYLVTATSVLEGPEEWPGRYIPIVPMIGKEIRIGKRVSRKGIVRDAKPAQRMYNYYASAHTEIVALQPKAPFMVTEANVAKYQNLWNAANTRNLPYLIYNPDKLNGGASPQRVQPPVSSQGIADGLALANDDMRKIIGIYDASLGARSNETSGKAILARQREGDVGTYVFIDNFTRAINQVGKILIDLIPHVYDTQRTIRIIGEDGKVDLLKINQQQDDSGFPIVDENGQPIVLNDITTGSYDVVTETGPSYSTKREEARESITEFVRSVPNAAPLILDLLAKMQDWPMADKISQRMKIMLPPQILQAEQAEEGGEQVPTPMQEPQGPPVDPEKMARAEQVSQSMQISSETAQMDMAHKERMNELEYQIKQADLATKMAQLQRLYSGQQGQDVAY